MPEEPGAEGGDLAQLDKVVRPEVILAFQHLLAVHHRDQRAHRAAGQGRGAALLQSHAVLKAGRGGAHRRHRATRGRRRCRFPERAGQNPGGDRRPRRLHRQALLFGYLNHAVAMYGAVSQQGKDLDARMRYGCGYPMGPLALLD